MCCVSDETCFLARSRTCFHTNRLSCRPSLRASVMANAVHNVQDAETSLQQTRGRPPRCPVQERQTLSLAWTSCCSLFLSWQNASSCLRNCALYRHGCWVTCGSRPLATASYSLARNRGLSSSGTTRVSRSSAASARSDSTCCTRNRMSQTLRTTLRKVVLPKDRPAASYAEGSSAL
jgi:hypothetical protein